MCYVKKIHEGHHVFLFPLKFDCVERKQYLVCNRQEATNDQQKYSMEERWMQELGLLLSLTLCIT
jgi:hypothetical protein